MSGGATGKGGAIVLLAKVYFILVGFAQQVLLRGVLGLDAYGRLSLALSVANVVNNVVVSSSIQGTSKLVASLPEEASGSEQTVARGTLRAVLKLHLALAAALGIGFLLIGTQAARFIGNPALLRPLHVLTIVVVAYALYAPVIGALNGLRLFRKQALLDVFFATLRTIGLVFGAWAFLRYGVSGVLGATVGFASAATLVVPASLLLFGLRSAARVEVDARAHLMRLLALAAGQFFSNAIMQGDLLLFGRFVQSAPTGSGLGPDAWVGIYRACQTFAFLPYQLLLGVAQILFPLVAKARAEGDDERVALMTRRGFRATWIVIGLLVSGLFATRAQLLAMAFGREASAAGSSALAILLVGQAAFALFGVTLSVLASLGKEKEAAIISAGALGLVGTSATLAGTFATSGASVLLHAMMAAVSGALIVSFAVVTRSVVRASGGYSSLGTTLRTVLAVALVGLSSSLLPPMGLVLALLTRGGLAVAIYVGVLVLLREVSRQEMKDALRVIRTRAF